MLIIKNFEEFESKMDEVLFVSATPANYELEKSGGEYVRSCLWRCSTCSNESACEIKMTLQDTKFVITYDTGYEVLCKILASVMPTIHQSSRPTRNCT